MRASLFSRDREEFYRSAENYLGYRKRRRGATLTMAKGYSDNFELGDGEVDFDGFNGVGCGQVYLVETVKNSSAPPKTTSVIEKSGEILQRLL